MPVSFSRSDPAEILGEPGRSDQAEMLGEPGRSDPAELPCEPRRSDPSAQAGLYARPPLDVGPAEALPVGKLPADLLQKLLGEIGPADPSVVVGPGIGLDCAVVRPGPGLLVVKSDPITFAADEIGRYLVHVNANDLATAGATPRWLTATLLLPESASTPALAEGIMAQVQTACRELGISLVGGHTEVTHGLDRPILAGTLIGVVEEDRLVTSRGARPGDRVLLTKSVPLEAAAILARELPHRLTPALTPEEIAQAAGYLHRPGISVVPDARAALRAGRVTAMHDPTEGGLAAALWELATASGHELWCEAAAVPVDPLAGRICAALGLDPLATIASGALLFTVAPEDAEPVASALAGEGIPCTDIGQVAAGPARVVQGRWTGSPAPADAPLWPRPLRDEIGKAFQ